MLAVLKELKLLKNFKHYKIFYFQLKINMNNYYVGFIYLIFTLIWIIIILSNNFQKNDTFYILFIPVILFTIGFFNCDNCNPELQKDIFNISFINVGLLLSLPLLKVFNDKKEDKQLNHIIFLSMIFILLTYYHIWIPLENRYICKIIQSCIETFAITLYIFAISIFFLQ